MSGTAAAPVTGRIMTPFFKLLIALWALGTAAGVVRWTGGLGAATAMNDGYPWGIWITLDVVVGTALACGGYAVAILAYVFNRGQYHPIVRPAILTSALGYSVAGIAIFFDVGRYWGLWKIPLYAHRWNLDSALLEVALCVMAYTAVLWIELSPAVVEQWLASEDGSLRARAARILPGLSRALPFVLALGLLLPTMHQSTLGALWLVAPSKLHPLWHTPLLPLLFLVSCLAMGYAVVVLEGTFSSRAFKRPRETAMFATLGTAIAGVTLAWVVLRLGDLALRGRLGLVLGSGGLSFMFLLENALAVAGAVVLLRPRLRSRSGMQLAAAFLVAGAGVLYRIDTFLVAYDPGPGWSYFPSVGEILVTLGLVATETMAYLFIVRKLPILAGAQAAVRHPDPEAS
jgi:Ni/Fe-hydrogenase subunit HybB-like protein